MATKNYMINDKWLDLDKQNIVELQSVDGELDSLKVNGSEIETPSGKITITENGTDIDIAQYALADVNVEGGGGSSDFSTAEVTVNFSGVSVMEQTAEAIMILNDELIYGSVPAYNANESYTVDIVLYKGSGKISFLFDSIYVSSSGACTYDADNGELTVTGNCAITVNTCMQE